MIRTFHRGAPPGRGLTDMSIPAVPREIRGTLLFFRPGRAGARACGMWLRRAGVAVDDRELMRRALAGERAAVEAFVDRVAPLIDRQVRAVLYRYGPLSARSSVGQEVDDLRQIVFAELFAGSWRLLRAWDPARGGLDTYVRWVAQSKAIDHLRKRSRRPWAEEAREASDLDGMVGPLDATVESRVIDRDQLHLAFDRVSAECTDEGKRLLELLFVEDLPVPEVRAATGLSENAVHKWRSRLRGQLRQALADLLREPGTGRTP